MSFFRATDASAQLREATDKGLTKIGKSRGQQGKILKKVGGVRVAGRMSRMFAQKTAKT